MSIWTKDPIGTAVLTVVLLGAIGALLWHLAPAFVALGPWTHIAVLATIMLVLFAGITWRHIEAVRAYERGEW